jgi:hypothetical protein
LCRASKKVSDLLSGELRDLVDIEEVVARRQQEA